MFGSFRDLAFLGAAAGSGVALDPDAQAYITAVENVDGQALEIGVRDAINDFVVGCKADGIWTAIKASCILAGARTLNGALRPLVGAAPTNFNFVSGDYNRKTGLVGDGSTKYLDSNRTSGDDPLNNFHMSAYATHVESSVEGYLLATKENELGRSSIGAGGSLNITVSQQSSQAQGYSRPATPFFIGHSRINGVNYNLQIKGISSVVTATSNLSVTSTKIGVFARNLPDPPVAVARHRLAFYSIGESLDLALLDARVTTLINAFAAVIP
jgi:hypothetical protein